jgi:hypothetical protein
MRIFDPGMVAENRTFREVLSSRISGNKGSMSSNSSASGTITATSKYPFWISVCISQILPAKNCREKTI